MIQPNPAKVNFTKVNFTYQNTHKIKNHHIIYDSIYLPSSDENYYNKKIDYVDTLYITNTTSRHFYNYKKLNIKKINNIIIFVGNIKNINMFINFCVQLKPNMVKFSIYENIDIPIIKLPYHNTFIDLNYNIHIYKTIFHCGTLIITFGKKNQNLITNLNFLNSNICYFQLKKLEFRYPYFSIDENIKSEYILNIKKILQPYPNIKFYTIT